MVILEADELEGAVLGGVPNILSILIKASEMALSNKLKPLKCRWM